MLRLWQKLSQIKLCFRVIRANKLNLLRKDELTLQDQMQICHGLAFSHDDGASDVIVFDEVVLVFEQSDASQVFKTWDLS